jgi:thioredoxin 1
LFNNRFKALKARPGLREHQTKLNSQHFNGNRLKNAGTIPVLFYARWCPFCTRFYPEFATALNRRGIEWGEVDVSEYQNPLWELFSIGVVPTIIVFQDGEAIFRKDGVLGQGLSEKTIEEVLIEVEREREH